MSSFEIYFTRPWLLLLLIPGLLLAVVPYIRLTAIRRRSLNRKISLAVHSLIVVLAVFLLSGLTFYHATDHTQVIVVADLSDSTEDVQSQMNQYIQSIAEEADSGTKVGVVTYAYGSVYASELSSNADQVYQNYLSSQDQPDVTATNLEDALKYAATLFGEDGNKRIIVLSDGEETDGDALSEASLLSDEDVRIDAVYLASTDEPDEVEMKTLEVPDKVDAGTLVSAAIEIESNTTTSGTLKLYDNTDLISEQSIAIAEGTNQYEISYTVDNAGLHAVYAEVTASEDTETENNGMYGYISASGAGNILVIDGTGDESEKLSQILGSEYNITVTSAAGAADYEDQLPLYEEVILMNVDNADLPSGFDQLLEHYVSDLGGGLLTIGGDQTYAYGNMTDTAFEDMLPVAIEPDDVQTVALILVIDSSSSMNGTNLTMAKQGASNSVNALNDTDYVGVITFATNMTVVSKLTSVTNKASVLSGINNISTSRGTNMYSAVYEAYNELKDFDADIKHVIILSDGNPTDSGSDKVIKLMANAGITTSTICLGSSANTTLMKTYAEYGGGRYYNVTTASDLPDVMLDETVESQTSFLNEVTFSPVINSYTTELNGVTTLAQMKGYISTSAKSDATLVLSTDDDNHAPLYAKWSYGTGKVGSFTSDLNGTWSGDLLSSSDGITLIKNMVAGLMPSDNTVSGLYVNLEEQNYTTDVKITSSLETGESLEVVATAPSGEKQTVNAQKEASGAYTATIETKEQGIYTILVLKYAADGTLSDYSQKYLASSYSDEYDTLAENTGKTLLLEICREADGEVADSVQTLFDLAVSYVEYEHNPYQILVVAVLLLFLSDIAIRKFKIVKKKKS